ncbi:MAG: hypothetical protein PHP37_04385 [Patescibacteria group bacterium]|nr:hypothetical protein [Patescibacteria group bacterium]
MDIQENEKKTEQNVEESNDLILFNLLKENLKVSREILDLSRYIKKYILWQKVIFWFKFVVILIPIILALIYLPPFLRGAFSSFQELINPAGILNEK